MNVEVRAVVARNLRRSGYAGALLRASYGNLSSVHRFETLGALAKMWLFAANDILPTKDLSEILPGISDTPVTVRPVVHHPFQLPVGDLAVLVAILQHLDASLVFEFGTWTGSTTVVLADALHGVGVVHTVDLPPSADDQASPVGSLIRDRPDLHSRIVQHRCDLRSFNIEPWRNQADLVFIDASHEYEDVLADSAKAFELVAPGGAVVWDDYQPAQPGVVKALNELAGHRPLAHVAGSRLVVSRA